ncbi:hypothetical protein Hanom_Chr17g01584441 [Helianthus anomalus]
MEIYNMILSSIIRVNEPGIGRVSLNPISAPEFFHFLSPYPSGFEYTRPVCFGYTRHA